MHTGVVANVKQNTKLAKLYITGAKERERERERCSERDAAKHPFVAF